MAYPLDINKFHTIPKDTKGDNMKNVIRFSFYSGWTFLFIQLLIYGGTFWSDGFFKGSDSILGISILFSFGFFDWLGGFLGYNLFGIGALIILKQYYKSDDAKQRKIEKDKKYKKHMEKLEKINNE